jgi:hypothetical protein
VASLSERLNTIGTPMAKPKSLASGEISGRLTYVGQPSGRLANCESFLGAEQMCRLALPSGA